MKKHLKLIIAASVAIVLIVPTIITIAVLAGRDDEQTFSLAGMTQLRVFDPHIESFPLPAVQSNGSFTYTWAIHTGYNFAELDDHESRFRPLPLPDGMTSANLVFRATVVGENRTVTLDYNLELRDPVSPTLNRLFSSNQSGRAVYRTQGIARQRVFGLWDIAGTEDSFFNPAEEDIVLSDCKEYQKSGDVMLLTWRYTGAITMLIELLDENDDVIAINGDDVLNITKTENANGIVNRLDIEFLDAGMRTIRATATSVTNPQQNAVYSFTYDIHDAINAFVFEDVKRVERNARFDYIINGVVKCAQAGTYWIEPLAVTNPGLTIDNFYNAGHSSPLHSSRFATSSRTHDAGRPIGQVTTWSFNEFYRWSPSFTYRDLVIRDNMETWAEGTWFFGNVFGNGHQIDATPYSRQAVSPTGVFRNVHGTGSTGCGQGFERETTQSRRGSGWGEKYAFYMLSNHTTLDNITLTGHNVVHADGRAVLISDHHTVSVLGTSHLSGHHHDFQAGNRHNYGDFTGFDYQAGIRIQNSIIEKGFILIGASYAINHEYPITVDTVVLRYGAFCGIFMRSFSGSEGGAYVRQNNEMGEVTGYYEAANSPIRPGLARRFGNFVVARNLTIYDLATAPFIGDENNAGSHLTVEGEHNNFYTWMRVADLILPSFRFPGTHWASTEQIDAERLAQSVIADMLRDPQYRDGHITDGATSWLNLLFLGIEYDFNNAMIKSNHMDLGNSNLNAGHFFNIDPFVGFPIGPDGGSEGLQINAFIFRVPTTASPHVVSREQQIARFASQGGMANVIRNKCIVNGIFQAA